MVLTTDGARLWSKTLGDLGIDSGTGVAIDSSGNVVIVGEFEGKVDFGGGPLASGGRDVFVAKYVGLTGAHLFSKRYGGKVYGTAFAEAISVTIDSLDNIVVVGKFDGPVDFGGPAPLTDDGYGALFVAKYTLAGAYLWAKSFHAVSMAPYGWQFPRSVVAEDAGDIVLAGEFCGTISFGGPDISSASDCFGASGFPWDSFAVRLTSASGGHVSSVRVGSRSSASRIGLTADGRLYLIGSFNYFAEIGGSGLTPVGSADAFILALAPL